MSTERRPEHPNAKEVSYSVLTSSSIGSDAHTNSSLGAETAGPLDLRLTVQAALLEQGPDAMLVTDPNGRVIYFNAQAERLFGYARVDIIGVPVEHLIPHHLQTRHVHDRRKFESAPTFRHMSEARIVPAQRKDGSQVSVTISLVPLPSADGVRLLAIIRDATPFQQLEERLLHTKKMEAVGRLAGGVAHDFNNILTIISGYATMLVDDPNLPTQYHEFASNIAAAALKAADLTTQLLAFSRRQVMVAKVIDLNKLCSGMVEILRRLIVSNISLDMVSSILIGHIKADPGQLEQVILNLVLNARDAMPEGGRIILDTGIVELDGREVNGSSPIPPGIYVTLSVTDTGCGMDQETLNRIFEPFFTTKDHGRGTGLGLASVYGIVKQSHGHIDVFSKVGFGTTFKLYFPWVGPDLCPEPNIPRRTLPSGCETLLLVEDDADVRKVIESILVRCNYTVVAVPSGAEALRLATDQTIHFDLVITDVLMPEMSGLAFAARLMKTKPGVRFLFISGCADDEAIPQGVLRASENCLQKPISPLLLAQKVREILDRPAEGPDCDSTTRL